MLASEPLSIAGKSTSLGGGRLLQIDVLRGVAAVAVFLFHVAMAVGFPKRTLPEIDLFGHVWTSIPNVFSFGASGVSLFFVVSGYCLALNPLRNGAKSLGFRDYSRHRFSRIYPACFVAVLFSVLVTEIRGIDWGFSEVFSHLFFLQGFIQKWHFSLNGALWSMATEVQFYAIFPLLFAVFVRLRSVFFIPVIIFLVMLFRIYCATIPSADLVVGGIAKGTFMMNMLPGRLLEFLLGMLIAKAWLEQKSRLVDICRLLLLPAVLAGVVARMKGPTWLADPVLGFMYAVVVGYVSTRDFRINGSSVIASFGRSSYSFFLLHLPVVVLIQYVFNEFEGFSLYEKFFLLVFLGFLITTPLSYLLYRHIEVPCGQYFNRRSVPISATSGVA